MIWNEFIIKSNSNGAAILEERLSAIGIMGVATKDPEMLREMLETNAVPWDYIDESLLEEKECTTTFYLSDSTEDKTKAQKVHLLLDELKSQQKDYGSLILSLSKVDDESWANNWKQYFKPLEIGNSLVVLPSWEEYLPDDDSEPKVIVEIDPASSFGTGQHESTALCLELLEKEVYRLDTSEKPVVFLDMGCGSGILGIAGLLLAKKSTAFALGVDIDENAVNTAIENAAKNGVSKKYTAYHGDIVSSKFLKIKLQAEAERAGNDRGYNIILANIVADVLIDMSEILIELLADGGLVICSGIILAKSELVEKAFVNKGAVVETKLVRNEWVALGIRKKQF